MRYSSLLLLCTGSMAVAGVAVAPARPLITPGPSIAEVELRRRVDSSRMDLGSLAQVLLTDVPPSLLDLAITNIPALSKILWSEFLDSNTPSWFTALPSDVQAYLSGQFGPTTAASNTASSTSSSQTTSAPSASQTAANNQLDNSHDSHHSGLPLWAKILIGVLVPLLILGLLACLLLCCLRRRRRQRKAARAQSRTPTPAFVSSSHRAAPHGTHGEQHVPLRGGYLTSTDSSRHNSDHIPHHHSSSSEEFRTPIGGPSYEELPAPVTGAQALRRSSRQSLSSLHSVPEVPEPMHGHGHGAPVPLPPRSPRRSRDFSQDAALGNTPGTKSSRRVSPLNPMYNANQPNPYYNQGIYAGGHNPYPDHSYHSSENPFADHSPPQQGGYMPYRSSYGDRSSRDQELFFNGHGNRHSQEPEGNWPLQALEDGGYRTAGRGRPHEVYEKVYEM